MAIRPSPGDFLLPSPPWGEGKGDEGTDCHVGALPLLAMTGRGNGIPLRGFSSILPNSTKRAIISPAHGYALALPVFGRREAPSSGGGRNFCSSSTTSEGGDGMVTYSDLFQFGILIVGIISLVIQVNNKKK